MIPLTITDVRAIPGDSAFLIDDGETSVLYDTGYGFTGYAVAERIRSVLGNRPLNYILLTHSHYDHALGSAYIRRRYPEVRVVAGTYADRIFRKSSARALMRELDRKAALACGITEYDDLADQLRVDIPVSDGDTVRCGAMEFRVVALPGHTKCSVGYFLSENRLLLGTETLGVYFGEGTYLPSYLVGYQMALDSIRRAKELDIQSILLPHYGPVSGPEAQTYLCRSEQAAIDTARSIREMLRSGRTREEVLDWFTQTRHSPRVAQVYSIDAFRLNTGIMIRLIQQELC